MSAEVPLQVVVRVRPLIGEEINRDACLYCVPNEAEIVVGHGRHFYFDHVLNEESSQADVYDCCVRPLCLAFFEGYNATVFTYGQTGSGKTYTMGTGNCVYLDEKERGIIPRAVADVFSQVEKLQNSSVCKIRLSFIEIYKEETTDLLENSSKSLLIREDEAGNTVVVGVREEPVETFEEVLNILDAGTAIRHVGATNMNEASSRSHCIFTLRLDQYPLEDHESKGNVLSSQFHFVDLAGSERAHRTGNQGERFKESVSINNGLLALSNVICALSDPKRKLQHVPYRESKLTRLLKDSLGGNSRTVMITCLSPALSDLDENINSLKYATRAKTIRNKPKVNWDMESSKLNRMQTEIEILKTQLKSRGGSAPSPMTAFDVEKINILEVENEKHESEHQDYLKNLHAVNSLLQAVDMFVDLPVVLKHEIGEWRKGWEKSQFVRPMTAPSRGSMFRRPQNDVIENLRCELDRYKEECESKCRDLEELRQDMIEFGEENAQLRLELDVAVNSKNELQEKLLEQHISLQQFNDIKEVATYRDEKEARNQLNGGQITAEERLFQTFRAKSNLLISQHDDLDEVKYDENITSDEDEESFRPNGTHRIYKDTNQKKSSQEEMKQPLVSNIPRLIKSKSISAINRNKTAVLRKAPHENMFELTHGYDTAKHAAKIADINMIDATNQLRELQLNIRRKEELITDLSKSEKAAKETIHTFSNKLNKLEKEYEEAKKNLEDAHSKITDHEKSSNNKDTNQKSKLQNDFKKRLTVMQKKYDTLNKKQTVQNRLASYQETNEKKIKELEANISRMKNQHIELERKYKSEADKKSKFQHESQKNEQRIKELEVKTNKQEKLLKRKNEEVATAQRKLRTTNFALESSKLTEHLEKKRVWLDNEIEKIIARKEEIDLLEVELRERDESLKKKETLLSEKDELEIKKSKSNKNLSQSIVKLSLQMDTIDEQIKNISQTQPAEKPNKNVKKLISVKTELNKQKEHLELSVKTGGLELYEERRLIELGEALEAVDEAIVYKNDLINQKQSFLSEKHIDSYNNVDHLLNDMGELTKDEYKHLLAKLFLKIVELRTLDQEHEESRCHFELTISEQEKKIFDLQHMSQIIESRHEQAVFELNINYEKEMQFLVEQLRVMESEMNAAKDTVSLTKRIKILEKELYYYKVKARKYKEQLKDFSNDVSTDPEELFNQNHPRVNSGGKPVVGDEFHFPPVQLKAQLLEHNGVASNVINAVEHQRLQDIFDSKPPTSSMSKKPRKDELHKNRFKEDISFTDSIESSTTGTL